MVICILAGLGLRFRVGLKTKDDKVHSNKCCAQQVREGISPIAARVLELKTLSSCINQCSTGTAATSRRGSRRSKSAWLQLPAPLPSSVSSCEEVLEEDKALQAFRSARARRALVRPFPQDRQAIWSAHPGRQNHGA